MDFNIADWIRQMLGQTGQPPADPNYPQQAPKAIFDPPPGSYRPQGEATIPMRGDNYHAPKQPVGSPMYEAGYLAGPPLAPDMSARLNREADMDAKIRELIKLPDNPNGDARLYASNPTLARANRMATAPPGRMDDRSYKILLNRLQAEDATPPPVSALGGTTTASPYDVAGMMNAEEAVKRLGRSYNEVAGTMAPRVAPPMLGVEYHPSILSLQQNKDFYDEEARRAVARGFMGQTPSMFNSQVQAGAEMAKLGFERMKFDDARSPEGMERLAMLESMKNNLPLGEAVQKMHGMRQLLQARNQATNGPGTPGAPPNPADDPYDLVIMNRFPTVFQPFQDKEKLGEKYTGPAKDAEEFIPYMLRELGENRVRQDWPILQPFLEKKFPNFRKAPRSGASKLFRYVPETAVWPVIGTNRSRQLWDMPFPELVRRGLGVENDTDQANRLIRALTAR